MSIRHIHRATLQTWLTQGKPAGSEELALLDIRSVDDFAKGHPLFGTNLPVESLERDVTRFVPRKSVKLVLVDGGDSAADGAARLLARHGYTDINVLSGGVPAWNQGTANGLPTFDVPGIVFSQSIRDLHKTPSIDSETLKKHFDAKDNVIVIDTRTPPEFARAHVPHAVNVPGAEILHRFLDVVPDPQTLVVVSCAGLPRAIIGAQTLIDAGVPNRVVYLEDGTAGWTRASLTLAKGEGTYPAVSDDAREFGAAHARTLAGHAELTKVGPERVANWLDSKDERTTYLLDVRSEDEYVKGHVPGAISSPGGQLLAVSHRTVATRGARLVLLDDDGTRAITTAFWLKRRGWEVYWLDRAAQGSVESDARETVETA